jgi:hypothetical protein
MTRPPAPDPEAIVDARVPAAPLDARAPQPDEDGRLDPPDAGGSADLAAPPDLGARDLGSPPGGDAAGSPVAVPAFCRSYPPAAAAGQWQSAHVRYSGGLLTYPADGEQNRIPDFSYAGYKYGEAALPSVPDVMRLSPAPGDNTARIQAALDAVGARPLDGQGLRGALVLAPGRYEIAGTLRVNQPGVVLRGSGHGADPAKDTILVATGDTPHQRPVVVVGTGVRSWPEGTPKTDITTPFVQVGSLQFEVASAAGFAVGDPVVIRHPSTQAWIDALGGGGVAMEAAWAPGSYDITYLRFIRKISGNTLSLDAPIFNHLDRKLSQATVAKATMRFAAQVAVEDLRVDITTAGGEDENHAWTAIWFQGAIDSWARRVTALHFGYAGFDNSGSLRVTIADSTTAEPVGIRTGSRFYNFAMGGNAQLVLVRDCEGSDGRHTLVSNGASTASGNVFYRCRTNRGGSMEGGHRGWTQAMLYDNVVESATSSISLFNAGDFGTGHGWGCAHCVVWNFNATMTVQKPPTAQNYAISSSGRMGKPTFPGPDGSYELKGAGLAPASLYEAQLCERLRR